VHPQVGLSTCWGRKMLLPGRASERAAPPPVPTSPRQLFDSLPSEAMAMDDLSEETLPRPQFKSSGASSRAAGSPTYASLAVPVLGVEAVAAHSGTRACSASGERRRCAALAIGHVRGCDRLGGIEYLSRGTSHAWGPHHGSAARSPGPRGQWAQPSVPAMRGRGHARSPARAHLVHLDVPLATALEIRSGRGSAVL